MSEKPQAKLGAGVSRVAAFPLAVLDSGINHMFDSSRDLNEVSTEIIGLVEGKKNKAIAQRCLVEYQNSLIAVNLNYIKTVLFAAYPRLAEVLSTEEIIDAEAMAIITALEEAKKAQEAQEAAEAPVVEGELVD